MNEQIFEFPLWACWIPNAVAFLLVIYGFFKLCRGSRYARTTIVSGILTAILFGPMLFMDRLVLTDSGMTHRTGFWFCQSVRSIDFTATAKIESRYVEVSTAGHTDFDEIWVVTSKTGKVHEFKLGDLLAKHQAPVRNRAEANGIPFW